MNYNYICVCDTSKLTIFTDNSYEFVKLYGKDSRGNIKEWSICVTKNGNGTATITCRYGLLHGKKIESTTSVTKGKNIGKRNETTPFTQAVLQAESKWNHKRDTELYTTQLPTTDHATATINATEQSTPPLPMLAQDYTKHKHKMKFPCYIQPKLDGYRMIYDSNTHRSTTRTGKEYTVLQGTDLIRSLVHLTKGHPSLILDGELYIHDPLFSFESYGVLRKQKPEDLSIGEKESLSRIEYHVYDIISSEIQYKQRQELLKNIFTDLNTNSIRFVKTYMCENAMEVDKYHELFVKDNYEGSIIRNGDGMYRQKYRSYDLLKRKDFHDHEFTIVDFTSEQDTTGNNCPLIVWICETESKRRFNVQSKGTREERQTIYKCAGDYIGQRLWVQHFGFTADGIPRFPKTMRNGLDSIRNDRI